MYVKLDEFRSGHSQRRFPIMVALSSFLILLSAIIIATELVTYSDAYNNISETFGSDVRIGGVQVGGLNEADRLARLESVYVQQPILLYYKDSPILLMPNVVGFRLDTDAMQAAANTQVEGDFWGGFWKYLWRNEERALNIPLIANFEPAQLRAYLEELALRYDTASSNINFDPGTFTFRGTEGRTQLNINETIPLIEKALYEIEPSRRIIDLPLTTVPGEQPTMDTLRQAIIDYFGFDGRIFYDGPDTAAAVFVIDLENGEEMGINQNVLINSASTIKIGVLINYFRHMLKDPTEDDAYKLGEMVICSVNGSANTLIDRTDGSGYWVEAFRNLNTTMCEAGAVNTQLTTHLWIGSPGEGLVPADYYTIIGVTPCPGSTVPSAAVDTSLDLRADVQNRSTASDMGTMLMQIYDCAIHGGGLRTIFPEEITQLECQYIMELLRGTYFRHMMELGLPEGVEFAHKVGYDSMVFGDVGFVFSPGGDYVFVMYVWELDKDGNNLTDINKWAMIGDVSRIVYNYFNPDQPMLETRQPDSQYGGGLCVMPATGYPINLTNIEAHRFDEYKNPIPGESCYGYAPFEPCLPFDNWGRN